MSDARPCSHLGHDCPGPGSMFHEIMTGGPRVVNATPLTPGEEVARRENCWRIAEAFMEDWNTRSSHSTGRVGSHPLFKMTMELARFLAEPTPTLIEVAGGDLGLQRLSEELNDNQGEQ